jgi:hypothetical protein
MVIEKPIIIFGAERSGTTLLYSVLSNHPDLYWFSRLDSLLPGAPVLTTTMRRIIQYFNRRDVFYIAVPNTISFSRGLIPPSECVPYWRKMFRFVDENDDSDTSDDYYDKSDFDIRTRDKIHADLSKRLSILAKKRLLIKLPAFSLKIGYLNELFLDGLFIHVIRDPYCNFASLVRAKKSSGRKFWGSKFPGWKKYLEADLDLQAIVQLKSILEIIEKDISSNENLLKRYIQIRYEDLVSMPKETLTWVLDFCELQWIPEFDMVLSGIVQRSNNQVSNPKSKVVENELQLLSMKYGYDISSFYHGN